MAPGDGWLGARVVASYQSYEDAEAAVDALADQDFPVERVAIVGSGLKLVERVLGRWSVAKAAADGALTGAFAGTAIGFVLGLFVVDDTDAIALVLFGLVFGLAFGGLWALLARWAGGGQRDFVSARTIAASRYDVVAEDDVADEVRQFLGELRLAGSTASSPTGRNH